MFQHNSNPVFPLHQMNFLENSMSCTSTKGLLNEPGQNNCFLNSAVQVLWHLDIFRRSFRNLMGHACMAESCIFCALKELFSQLQFSNESALPPDTLRKALAESFSDQQRFQLGFMDDAAECFENILLRIHMHIAHGESPDMCNAQHCVAHQKFAMTLVEQTVCGSCRATSEPLSYTQMVHYVSTSTLVYQVRNGGPRNSPYHNTSFGQLLRKAGNMGDVRMCPSHCGAVIQISRTLMNWPEIVSIGLVWNSERPSLEHIMEVFSTIGTSIKLEEVFNSATESKWNEGSTHNLVGVVTYYGKHYSTFFFHTKLKIWIYFDDATVRQVGPHWEQVVEKCRKGRYQPLLLLYASPDGTPVNTENAPKRVTQIYQQKNVLKRSVTPSPEKPSVGTMRRAITPNPDTLNQKHNEYQNLSFIQSNIHNGRDEIDGVVDKPPVNIHRTLSNGSSSGIEGISDHMNFPRRRDSGNWSGDRNSASSTSSTTMDNPYLYLVGKVPQNNPLKSDSSSTGSPICDAGYDSYSLSSNDSLPVNTLHHMMKIGNLAKIPEDYNHISCQLQNCDTLCNEADELLVKSRQLEDEHDLVLALALCNAAATKARAAMNAPYNNPQTLTLARMKHNTCIMRARSLHRRMTQTLINKEASPPEIRHTREGSSGSGRHSRQNSRDKGHHSRQNSKELLVNLPQTQPEKPTQRSIEIYATLPKRKDLTKNRIENIVIDDKKAQSNTNEKTNSGLFSRSKTREKRSRSEDRSKKNEFSLTAEITETKTKDNNNKEKENDKKEKKQHKIRRKLLMGGLMKRKNKSMPDLTDTNPEIESSSTQSESISIDDTRVSLGGSLNQSQPSLSGYLSEGHVDCTKSSPSDTNPNLRKSKLMKKSFYASAGRILSVPKVPPPPPLRTTSQLTTTKPNDEKPKLFTNEYQNFQDLYNNQRNILVTTVDVHRVENVDEVDSFVHPNLDLPPYPSPAGSAIHSRQASEEFPPPPTELDLSALEEHLPKTSENKNEKRTQVYSFHEPENSTSSLLKELQAKQAALKIKRSNSANTKNDGGVDTVNTQSDTSKKTAFVKDLASKFENRRIKTPKDDNDIVAPDQIAEEIREVAKINASLQEALNKSKQNAIEERNKNKLTKKKSVSFCDQVILVATAEDQDDDSYIPNPILERVLRSAVSKNEINNNETSTTIENNENSCSEDNEKLCEDITARNTMENSKVNSFPDKYFHKPPMNGLHQNNSAPTNGNMYPYMQQRNQLPNEMYQFPPQDHTNQYFYPTENTPQYEQMVYFNHPQNPERNNHVYQPQGVPQQFYNSPEDHGYYQYSKNNIPVTHKLIPNQYVIPQTQTVPPNQNRPYEMDGNLPVRHKYQYAPPKLIQCAKPAGIYQSVPYSVKPNHNSTMYQRTPNIECNINSGYYQNETQRRPTEFNQRIPSPYSGRAGVMYKSPNMMCENKNSSFECSDNRNQSVPKAVVTPILVNNANNSIPDKTKCNLCRKKIVASSNLYCADCEYYMSRFKPKT